MLNLNKIRRHTSVQSYTRGNTIYKTNGIVTCEKKEDYRGTTWAAAVRGSHGDEYKVKLVYSFSRDDLQSYECSCPAFELYDGMCKHCVALSLFALEQQTGQTVSSAEGVGNIKKGPVKERPTDVTVTRLISGKTMKENARYYQPETTGRVELVPMMNDSAKTWKVDFKIGADQKYVLKDIGEFVSALDGNKWVEYGKKLAFYHDISAFTENDRPLIGFLRDLIGDEKAQYTKLYGYSSYYASSSQTKRQVELSGEVMVRFAKVMAGKSCQIADGSSYSRLVTFIEEDPVLSMELHHNPEGGADWKLTPAKVWFGLHQLCIGIGSFVYLCSREFSEEMRDVAGLFENMSSYYHISQADLKSFCASVLPVLERFTLLKKSPLLEVYEQKPCQIAYYLDRNSEEEPCITAAAFASYGEDRYNVMESIQVQDMYRDIRKEQSALQLMTSYFPVQNARTYSALIPESQTDDLYRLLTTGILQMEQIGEVFISDALKNLHIVSAPVISVGVTLSSGLLDLTLQTDRFSMEELDEILLHYRRRKKYYRLKNGDFLQLENSSLGAVAELAEGLELGAFELATGHITLPEYRSFYVDQIMREHEGELSVKRNQMFKAFLRNMKNVEDSDYELPDGLNATLRPYQEYGFRWLMTLDSLGFGGILADDMGLGKTLQAIAFLLARKKEGPVKALIVCPASLVYNWENEIHRFTDGLVTETLAGSAPLRTERLEAWEADVYLTSYDLLKRDIDLYENITFDYMILDEAQNIKNHLTQAAKSVKRVSAGRRFALTGTPVENSLSELWSIFDYLMPGVLFSYKRFRDNYEQPISSSSDETVSARLKKLIKPFILRRLKKDVLKELPDKLEEVVYSVMEGEQQKLYDANLQRVLDTLNRQTEEEIRTGSIEVLAELTKLRQLCCDPSLSYETYTGGSAKLETCLELLMNAVESGNKVLLFSQFTSMLDIIKKRLEEEQIPYYMLTGQTSKEKRQALVQAFNQDETPVFLISLKAGGTGLNLTAASIVIHYDPWWNAAAQNQATDRAHRIGQEQVVTVYQLITKNTIEEKILHLQEKKAALSEGIIAEGSIRDTIGSKDALMELLKSGMEE